MLGTEGKWCILGFEALWVILEMSDDGTLEALQFIHTPLGVRTVAIVSPLSGDYGGENKNLRQKNNPKSVIG